MFGMDFSELMVIMVIALIVIGPERLPKVARTLGHLWGRGQRYVNGIKADIARDMAIDELRQLQQTVQQQASSVEQAVKQAGTEMGQQIEQLNHSLTETPATPAPPQTQQELELPQPEQQKKFPTD